MLQSKEQGLLPVQKQNQILPHPEVCSPSAFCCCSYPAFPSKQLWWRCYSNSWGIFATDERCWLIWHVNMKCIAQIGRHGWDLGSGSILHIPALKLRIWQQTQAASLWFKYWYQIMNKCALCSQFCNCCLTRSWDFHFFAFSSDTLPALGVHCQGDIRWHCRALCDPLHGSI